MWKGLTYLPNVIPNLFSQTAVEIADDSGKPAVIPLQQLSEFNQIRVIVGLFTVVVLGLVIFIVIKAGSHMAKGFSAAADRLPSESSPNVDDWASKPLNPPDESAEERPANNPQSPNDHDA